LGLELIEHLNILLRIYDLKYLHCSLQTHHHHQHSYSCWTWAIVSSADSPPLPHHLMPHWQYGYAFDHVHQHLQMLCVCDLDWHDEKLACLRGYKKQID